MICTIRFKDELFTCYGNGLNGEFLAGYCKNYGLECESKAFGEWMGQALQDDLLKHKDLATWFYDGGWKLNTENSIYGLRYNKLSGKVSIEERVGWEVLQDIASLCGWWFSVDVVGDYLKVRLAKK